MEYTGFRKEHLEECARVYAATFSAEPWYDPWDLESAFKRLSDIFNTPGFFGVVAEEDRLVRGAILGNIERWYGGCNYHLREMFVENNRRGLGIGGGLLNKLEQMLDAGGTTSIYLLTSKSRMTESFYLKNGYSRVNRMVMMSKKTGP